MAKKSKTNLTRTTTNHTRLDYLPDWMNHFYQAKLSEGVSSYTLAFYKQQLKHFSRFCDAQLISFIEDITPTEIRQFMLWHAETGHNPGGCHAVFRVLRTFLLWYEREVEPLAWSNPIHKVKAPRLAIEPLEPVQVKDVLAMAETCDRSFLGLRDRAMLLCLLDTGARAREFLNIDLADCNQVTGAILIRSGKGRKPRSVFLGQLSRKALRNYLKAREDDCQALWVTDDYTRLTYGGLRGAIVRRAEQTGIAAPGLHDFRRAFALSMLRNGTDLITLQRLMGHANLVVLQRYLNQVADDLQAAHARHGPVDHG